MRFLIVAVAVFACAAAAPSGALLAAPYSLGYAAPLTVAAVPAVNGGDLQAAAIDAHVGASDNVRAAVDAVQQINDQVAENNGEAINAAQEQAWSAVSAAQTAAAGIDGAAAGISPTVARSIVGAGAVAVAAPGVAAYSAPAVVAAPSLAAYSAQVLVPAPALVAGPSVAAYSAPGLIAGPSVIAGSQSISTQSLSQTHPVPLVNQPVLYGAHGLVRAW